MIEPRKLYRFAISLSDFAPVAKIWTTMDLEHCPRIGEAIVDFQNENVIQAYRVVDVVHWSSAPAFEYAGMLIVERLEENLSWLAVEEALRPKRVDHGSFQTVVR